MKTIRLCLQSFLLASINIGCILIGFRITKLFTNQILIQIPASAWLCILTFAVCTGWPGRFLHKNMVLQNMMEILWVYGLALVWSPFVFAAIHNVRWDYPASKSDFLSVWVFQIVVNPLVLATLYHHRIFSGSRMKKPDYERKNVQQFERTPRIQRFRALTGKMGQLRHNVLLAIISVCLTILLAELLLQGFYQPPQIISGWRSSFTTRSGRLSIFEKNQLGYRGQSIEYSPDDFVIVLVGDSQVQADACAYTWMPERRLEHHLNALGKQVKVFTVGANGYGQDQQFLGLQEYYKTYRADMVILWMTPVNDIWNNMFPTNVPANGVPKPTFWLENNELQGPSEQIGEMLATSKFKLLALWQHVFSRRRRDEQWEQYLPPPYVPMSSYEGQSNTDWQDRWDAGTMPRCENLEHEKSDLAVFLTPRSKRMEYGIELTRRLLHNIETLATSHNGKFVILRRSPAVLRQYVDQEEVVYQLNGKYYRASLSQFEENIHHVMQGFQSYVIPVREEDYWAGPVDEHLNEHAVNSFMQDLANTLVANHEF